MCDLDNSWMLNFAKNMLTLVLCLLYNKFKTHIDLISQMSFMENEGDSYYLLAIPKKENLIRILKYMLDEKEFLSPYGIRSLSKVTSII